MKKFTALISSFMLLTMGSQLAAQSYNPYAANCCNPCPPPCQPCCVPCAPQCGQVCGATNYYPAVILGIGAAVAAVILLTNNDPGGGHVHAH